VRYLFAALLLTSVFATNAQPAEEKVHAKVDDLAIIALLVSAVRPEYPYEARSRDITGRGVAVRGLPSREKVSMKSVSGRMALCLT
jgi:hypothetical protein